MRLTALRELRITAETTLERLPAFLGRLTSLERLHISVDNQGRCAVRFTLFQHLPTLHRPCWSACPPCWGA